MIGLILVVVHQVFVVQRLLFAARMHNFNRTIQQIVDVVKISKATIIRRLQEFETTPTAQLNMKEFDTH